MVKNSKIAKYDGEIEFDDLMESVTFTVGTVGKMKNSYVLNFHGKTKTFKDTDEIVPYVENVLHIKVTYGEAFDFDA